ncbi:MAG: hypothetical protein JEZ04_09390 [Spirochaetales bacterium]|nr:hypothetical protein [Spirochaetales bacterium]
MKQIDITCDNCMELCGDRCSLGIKLEPLYFSVCYRTDGYRPETNCPGPFEKSDGKLSPPPKNHA